MARRSSGGMSRSRSRSAPRAAARSTPVRNPPQPVTPAPPPAPARQGSIMGGLGSVVAEGMAFGGGSAIAHRAVDAVMGPRVIHSEVVVAAAAPAPSSVQAPATGFSDACGVQSKAFQDCLNLSGSEISKCQFYMDMLSECRKNYTVGLNA